jgi:DNA-directed RNA polymerase specialized sigma24 family protein
MCSSTGGSWPAASKGAAVTTWLLSIARFKALSARRRRTDAQLDETIETTVADSADDPKIALQKKSRGELVRAAMMKLSAEAISLTSCTTTRIRSRTAPWA